MNTFKTIDSGIILTLHGRALMALVPGKPEAKRNVYIEVEGRQLKVRPNETQQ